MDKPPDYGPFAWMGFWLALGLVFAAEIIASKL